MKTQKMCTKSGGFTRDFTLKFVADEYQFHAHSLKYQTNPGGVTQNSRFAFSSTVYLL